MLFVSDRSDRSDGSDGSVMGLMRVRRVCEVELKNNGADFILFLGMKSVLFLLEGWGEWFLSNLLYYDFFALICAFFLIIAIEKYFL